jgi:hypothetical protein
LNDLLLQKVGWIINNKDKGQIKLNKRIVECVKNYKEGIEQLQLRQDKNITMMLFLINHWEWSMKQRQI